MGEISNEEPSVSKLWSCAGTTIFKFQTQSIQVLDKGGILYMLREHICGVFAAKDFLQSEIPRPHPVLHPEICNSQVTSFA